MEPEEAVTEPDDEVYGCLSSEDSPHMSDEDKELQRLINEKKGQDIPGWIPYKI